MSIPIRTIGRVRAGRTSPIFFYLQEDDEDFDATGLTLSDVLLTTLNGQAIDTAGKFSLDTATGKVTYNPAAADFHPDLAPYRISAKVTDGAGKVRFYPEDFVAQIDVLAQRT
jgi:hypothetical protein